MPAEQSQHRHETCFHCGLPVPGGFDISVKIDGEDRAMCCHGCEAVAQSIVASGMGDFYRYRTDMPTRPEEIVPDFLSQLKAYDNPGVQRQFVDEDDEDADIREVSLILEGIVCAACVWLNEKTLQALDGVLDVQINYSTHRARIRWDNRRLELSSILEAISRIGYMAHPYDPERQQQVIERERRGQLRRLGISAVLGMQLMILAVAMYSGDWWGMEQGYQTTFRWLSLLICIPLLLFSSDLFFRNAWRDLRNARVGMDVPVALGMALAFSASTWHTYIGEGSVYFDSVAMFTFFLLSARYFELISRQRCARDTESMLNLAPALATRIIGDDRETVPIHELETGEIVLVKPGENIAVDGVITLGDSSIDESLITGESHPVRRRVGDTVIAGSTNTENILHIEVTHTGDRTVLASIQRMLESAQANKPEIAQIADRIAAKFVLFVLIVASSVALYWLNAADPSWLEYTVATLVVTCPCALSLATPTALTAASGRLARIGLLPVNNRSLETLAQASDFVFDKTGTLTVGELEYIDISTHSDIGTDRCLKIAAALERDDDHPIARAIGAATDETALTVKDRANHTGSGVSGEIDGQMYWFGNRHHIEQHTGFAPETTESSRTLIFLASQGALLATFEMQDQLRADANTLIDELHSNGMNLHLCSGDRCDVVAEIADELGIGSYACEQKPDDKLRYTSNIQQQGGITVMTGDGINDAPVLAAADVSIAMGTGSDIASAHADMILLSDRVSNIARGHRLARRTFRIIRQNLGWALLYNIVAIPAAAAGFVQPWLAAIGMSASSLIVVLNALRLSREDGQEHR